MRIYRASPEYTGAQLHQMADILESLAPLITVADIERLGDCMAGTQRNPEPLIGNTTKKYPTSRPAWDRRKRR
ncbi:hypothetical protein CQ010_01305 [Arthrobacter sp. MYb211]|nr:hypothetical protein CQ015_03560 [Arthrobacter sp. MYb221]PRC10508.1 hypothetical protein CQ010_01305 [Arthrobacter sp. MYb211]